MADGRLIAFDLGGTLQGRFMQPVHDDLRPALFEYAEAHPHTKFGIASNGNLRPAVRFLEDAGIGQLFGLPDTPYITYSQQLVTEYQPVEVEVPRSWRERLSGKPPETTIELQTISRHLQNKPHPDLLLHLMEICEVDPEHTVFIGDQPSDHEAALSAQVRFVAFDYFNHVIEPTTMADLLAQADALLPPDL